MEIFITLIFIIIILAIILRAKKTTKGSKETNNYIEIRSGLKKGDVVVTLGIENLSHGDELIVYREDEDVNTRNKRGK